VTLHELFIEPWLIGDWMWRGVLTASLVALPCAVLGCFLYLRRLSLMGDALAHVALPGVVGAYLLTGRSDAWTTLLGATASGLVTVGLVEAAQRRTRSDAAIGIVFSALFALGVIMLSGWARDAHIDLQCVLFGDVLGVADRSIWLLGALTALVLALTVAFYRPLQLVSFDPGLARALGVPVGLVHGGMMVMLSLTTVASFEAVGAILVIAALITPAATAHLVARRLHTMLGVAALHGLSSAVLGMYASIWINCSTAGAMVSVGAALYALTFATLQAREALLRREARLRLGGAP
jgi:manganese/zinc/iron transport system permease protein